MSKRDKIRKKKYDVNKLSKRLSQFATHGTMLIQAQGLGKAGKVWVCHNKPVPSGEWLSDKNLQKQTACVLRKHNIRDLMTLFWQEEEHLKNLICHVRRTAQYSARASNTAAAECNAK